MSTPRNRTPGQRLPRRRTQYHEKPAILDHVDEGAFDGYVDPNPEPHEPTRERYAPLAERDPEKSQHRKGQRLTPAELITIAQLDENQVTINDIARALNRHTETIRANLKASRQLLKAFAPEFVKDWKDASSKAASRGDHRPAMDALERMRLIAPAKGHDAPVSPFQINVGIGLPGLPGEQQLPTVKHNVPRDTLPPNQVPNILSGHTHTALPTIQGEMLGKQVPTRTTPSLTPSQPNSETPQE